MARNRGRYVPLSLARRMICDWLKMSQSIPLANGERKADLQPLWEIANACRPRPNWQVLFLKAYAMVAAERPILRRTYVGWPRPHFYEHPESIGSIAISRKLEGDDALFYLPITAPERTPLLEMEQRIRDARNLPLHEIPAFRRQLRFGKLPWPIRPLFRRFGMAWMGRQRVKFFGTFGMSVMASLGGSTLTTFVPWTTMLHFTPFDDQGCTTVRICLDHRTLDGLEVSLALREMQEILNGPIAEEVRTTYAMKRVAA